MIPKHYKLGTFEPFDLIVKTVGIGTFEIGNIIKYLLRYKNKNGVEDLQKAKFYIDRLYNNSSNLNIKPFDIHPYDDLMILIENIVNQTETLHYLVIEIITAVLKQEFVIAVEAINLLIFIEEEENV